MEITEILRRFERTNGQFARAAVKAAVTQREEITPPLLQMLESTADRASELAKDSDYLAHFYAMYLLAQFRETRAYPMVVRLALLPSETLEGLCGDFLNNTLCRILASVSGGEISGIQSIIENESADQWARSAALDSLTSLMAAGQRSRNELVAYFAELFRGKLARRYSYVWAALVCSSLDIYPAELMDDIELAYKDGLVDTSHVTFQEAEQCLALGKDYALGRLAQSNHHRLIDDTIQEMSRLPYFEEDVTLAPPTEDSPFLPEPFVRHSPVPTVVRGPKIGRNDPCLCGSGKKFKKCCGL